MPVIGAVVAVWTAIGEVAVIGGALQGTIIATAFSYGAQLFMDERGKDDFSAGVNANRIDTEAPIPIVYGERVVGGTEVFRAVTGAGNKLLHRVMVISEGEIDSLLNVYLNDHDVDAPPEESNDPDYRNCVSYAFHAGTNGQAADPVLVVASEDWTADCRGFGVAYLRCTLEYNQDLFATGIPTLTVKVRGRRVFDPRTGETAWSNNPALCVRDYLTNTRFGRGIDASAIDDDAIIAAANYCDELVTVEDADGNDLVQARYTCNGVVNPDSTSLDIIRAMLSSCRGMLIYTAGKYRLLIDKPEVSTFAFTEDNICGAWNIAGPSKRTMINRLTYKFFDPELNWQTALPVLDSPTHRAQDNGRVLEAEVEFPFTSQFQRAHILAQHHLKQLRQGWSASFTANLEALRVAAGDVVSITHPQPGWEGKLFRVVLVELMENDTVEVTVSEYDPSVYTFDLLTPPSIPDTNLPSPFATPPPKDLSLVSGTSELFVTGDGSVIVRLLATWSAPDSGFVANYEIAHKLASSSAWTSFITSQTEHHISPVLDGAAYDVRVRALYVSGRRSDWVLISGHVVIGKTEPPAAPADFFYQTQRDFTRQFSWVLVDEPDVGGYEIRYSTTLTHDWEEMLPLHSGLLNASPWETNLLNAGTYLFAIKAVDTTGNKSLKSRSITATLEDSPASSVIFAEYPRQLGWPGDILNGFIGQYGDLIAEDNTTWEDLTTWAAWESWISDGKDLTYTHAPIDIGQIITFRPIIQAIASGFVTYEIAYSDDGATYSAWETPNNQITARYLKARVKIVGDAPILTGMNILLDGKITVEDFPDLNTAALIAPYRIGVGDVRLPLAGTFVSVKTVTITVQNTGPGWSAVIVDKSPAQGPRIQIYDNNGALADCVIDASVKGY